ncbi:NAD(P)-dependent oxidoreductase [Ornithinimicrobium faecis]|uniref:NAD(P)-dependent oxidoreductase n=1 Tax=Ornithinimicrobium faecis TaxID=2934158 RepID=UPI002FC5AF64
MQITIFGATSTTGRLTVERALAAGHQVTAFTRDAARVSAQHDHLRVVEGDVTDAASCGRALDGADAVIITLGTAATD